LPPELLLLAQICTKSFVGWGFAYSAPPDPLAGLGGGAPGKGKAGGGKEGGEGRKGGRGGSPGMPKSRVGKPTLRKTPVNGFYS